VETLITVQQRFKEKSKSLLGGAHTSALKRKQRTIKMKVALGMMLIWAPEN